LFAPRQEPAHHAPPVKDKIIPMSIFATLLLSVFISSFYDTTAVLTPSTGSIKVRLYEIRSSYYRLELSGTDSTGSLQNRHIEIPFPVYHFEMADMDNDGSDDILIGVIKSTKFDPEVRKRLFAYKIDRGYIRPLWLGSKVGQTLDNFKAIKRKRKTFIRTIERGGSNTYFVGEYEWEGFGLTWNKYLGERVSYEKALFLFK
jgi:hypothetical protein